MRSFLSITGKVNEAYPRTPERRSARFMAYNNGIVVVADELNLGRRPMGDQEFLWLKGMQIVNGGQTTASIYFSPKKRIQKIDLKRVRIPAKVIVLKSSRSG